MKIKNLYQQLHKKAPIIGRLASFSTAAGVIGASTSVLGGPLWLMGATKVATGAQVADDVVIAIAKKWLKINNTLIDNTMPTRDWRVELPDGLSEDKQYLIISNHQSWVDTSVLQYISQDKLPLARFFTKHSLLYIPIIGQAFYFLDFPMMKRHTKEQIAKNPDLKNRDILEAKRACESLKDKPFALLNYVEGTRFSPKKRDAQGSPYQHLLKPKAGGLSLAMRALGKQVDGILDMTIVYPDGAPDYNDLWEGEVKRLGVHVQRIDVPKEFMDSGTDEELDDATKQALYAWLDDLWQQKDARITKMLAEFDNP